MCDAPLSLNAFIVSLDNELLSPVMRAERIAPVCSDANPMELILCRMFSQNELPALSRNVMFSEYESPMIRSVIMQKEPVSSTRTNTGQYPDSSLCRWVLMYSISAI